jgi:hypothetical protein
MENLSEFLIFDTRNIAQGPIARVELPFQIGWTPHGHWMDFSSKEATPPAMRANGVSAALAAA